MRTKLQYKQQDDLIEGISYNEIMYIKTDTVYSTVFLSNEATRTLHGSITELAELLTQTKFIQIHRNIFVNPLWIEEIIHKTIRLKEHRGTLAISARNFIEARKRFLSYHENTSQSWKFPIE